MCHLLTYPLVTDAKYEMSQNKKMYLKQKKFALIFRYTQVIL